MAIRTPLAGKLRPEEAAGAVNSTNLAVQLCDCDGKPLYWTKDIDSATASVVDLHGANEPCLQQFPGRRECPATLDLQVPPNTWREIRVEAARANKKGTMHFVSAAAFVDFGHPQNIVILACPTPVKPVIEDTSMYAVTTYWCSNQAGRLDRTRGAEIASATAELVRCTWPAGAKLTPGETHVPATIDGANALFALRSGCSYSIDVRLKEKYLRSHPCMPLSITAGSQTPEPMPIYFERCERVAAILFVESCGQPVRPIDVYRNGEARPLEISREGVCT
jgi:hypothetical protein